MNTWDDDSFSDTWQSEAASMDDADHARRDRADGIADAEALEESEGYWNDTASDAEADGDALDSVYGDSDPPDDIDRYDSGDDW